VTLTFDVFDLWFFR